MARGIFFTTVRLGSGSVHLAVRAQVNNSVLLWEKESDQIFVGSERFEDVHFTSRWPHEVTAIPFPPAAWSHRIRLGVSHPDPSST